MWPLDQRAANVTATGGFGIVNVASVSEVAFVRVTAELLDSHLSNLWFVRVPAARLCVPAPKSPEAVCPDGDDHAGLLAIVTCSTRVQRAVKVTGIGVLVIVNVAVVGLVSFVKVTAGLLDSQRSNL